MAFSFPNVSPYQIYGLVISGAICLRLITISNAKIPVIYDERINLARNGSSAIDSLVYLEPTLRVRVELPNHSSPLWEVLTLGIILGSVSMHYVILAGWLPWLQAKAGFSTISTNQSWISRENDEKPEDKCSLPKSAQIAPLQTEHVVHTECAPTPEAEQLESQSIVTADQVIDPHSEPTETDSISPINEDPSSADWIELDDLNQLESYLYDEGIETTTQPESPQLPAQRDYSNGVDNIMRPIQAIFAPGLEYQPMDQDLDTPIGADTQSDKKEILICLRRALGRFAIRQDDVKLLERIRDDLSKLHGDDLYNLCKVAIDYDRLHCFTILLPLIRSTNNRQCILEECACNNQVDMMKEALKAWTDHAKTTCANGPLVIAATHGHIASVHFLLTKCTNIEFSFSHKSPFVDARYPTPVMAASARGHKAVLQALIEDGATLRMEEQIASEITDPFLKGMSTNNSAMMGLLLDCDSTLLSGRSRYFATMLETAVRQNYPRLARAILAEIKDLDLVDSLGKSSFRMACERGYIDVMHAFIDHGADTSDLFADSSDIEEAVAIPSPARKRHELIVKLLKEHCFFFSLKPFPQSSSIVSKLAWLGDTEGLTMFMKDEILIELDETDEMGRSPLFHAMCNHMQWRHGMLQGYKLVNQFYCRMEYPGYDRDICRHVNEVYDQLCQRDGKWQYPDRWLRTVKLLLSYGAELNLQDARELARYYRGIPKDLLDDLRQLAKKEKNDNKPGC